MVRTGFLALAVILMAMSPSSAAKRALVIGNNAYTELPDLQKAVADAQAYDAVLRDLGYSVRLATDLPTLEMQQAIGDFVDSIEPGDEVAFVYAGHGWSDGSTNYVIGSDTPSKTSIATLRRAAFPLRNGVNGVIDDMQAQGARVVLAVVDACRNNPFESKLGRSGAVGLSRGLTLVAPVSGTFMVFSAGVGEEALDRLTDDDVHPNSVFSRVFLKELAEGGSLQDIVLDTAPQVAELAEEAGHQQRPAYYDGIGQRYCLTESCRRRPTAPEPADMIEIAAAAPAPAVDQSLGLPLQSQFKAAKKDPQRRQSTVRETTATTALMPPPTPVVIRAPLQFVVRNASPVRRVDQLKHNSICSVDGAAVQPTLAALSEDRGISHNNRIFETLDLAVRNLDGNKCNALAVRPDQVSLVLEMVRDNSRYIVLPEVIQ